MVFGVTAEQLRRVTLFAGILGGVALVVGLLVGYSHSTVQRLGDVFLVVLWALVLAAILPAAVGLAAVLRLRIDGSEIQQMVGPWVVARRPTHSLRRVAFGGRLFPVLLDFADGSRFRLLGLYLRDRPKLAASLRAMAPEVVIE
jgi:hypothetical protein